MKQFQGDNKKKNNIIKFKKLSIRIIKISFKITLTVYE